MKQSTNIQFLFEGYVDKVLLLFFKVPLKMLQSDSGRVKSGKNSGGGIVTVLKAMENQAEKNFHKTIVGVIDHDKKIEYLYYADFDLVEKVEGLIKKRHKTYLNQYLIILEPAIEQWILDCAKSVEVEPSDYDLPSILKELCKLTKSPVIENHQGFQNFLKKIKELEAPNFQTLQTWLDDFKNSPNQ